MGPDRSIRASDERVTGGVPFSSVVPELGCLAAPDGSSWVVAGQGTTADLPGRRPAAAHGRRKLVGSACVADVEEPSPWTSLLLSSPNSPRCPLSPAIRRSIYPV